MSSFLEMLIELRTGDLQSGEDNSHQSWLMLDSQMWSTQSTTISTNDIVLSLYIHRTKDAMVDLETELTSIFKSLASSLAPHFIESDVVIEGSKLVCVESPEIFASTLVLLGLDKKIPEVIKALHFVS